MVAFGSIFLTQITLNHFRAHHFHLLFEIHLFHLPFAITVPNLAVDCSTLLTAIFLTPPDLLVIDFVVIRYLALLLRPSLLSPIAFPPLALLFLLRCRCSLLSSFMTLSSQIIYISPLNIQICSTKKSTNFKKKLCRSHKSQKFFK